MARPSIYESAGGEKAFLALAAACHERCLQDPELNHPFTAGDHALSASSLATASSSRARGRRPLTTAFLIAS